VSTESAPTLLSRWLQAEPGAGSAPAGLEAEVVEAIYALRPERAPAARLTIDQILAEVELGPLGQPGPGAQALQRWLDDPEAAQGDDEDSLDEDVQGALFALRPDLAPAPRLRIDDILAELDEGPLAPPTAEVIPFPGRMAMERPEGKRDGNTGAGVVLPLSKNQPPVALPDGMPANAALPAQGPLPASVAAPKSRRPWLLPAIGALAAAASALLVVGPSYLGGAPIPSASREMAPAAAPAGAPAPASPSKSVDTGVVASGSAPMRASPKSRAHQPPQAPPREEPLAPPAKPAMARPTETTPTNTAYAESGNTAGPPPAEAPMPLAQPAPVSAPQGGGYARDEVMAEEADAYVERQAYADDAPAAKVKEEEVRVAKKSAPRSASRAPMAAPPPPAAASGASSREDVATRSPRSAPIERLRAEAQPIKRPPDLAKRHPDLAPTYDQLRAARGDAVIPLARPLLGYADPDVGQDAAFRIATVHLAAGRTDEALAIIAHGLGRGGAAPYFRSRLLALQGEVLERRGDEEGARQSYQDAILAR